MSETNISRSYIVFGSIKLITAPTHSVIGYKNKNIFDVCFTRIILKVDRYPSFSVPNIVVAIPMSKKMFKNLEFEDFTPLYTLRIIKKDHIR